LFRADAGKFEGAAETFGGGGVLAETPVEFADDGVEQVVRFEFRALRNFVDGVESGLGAVNVSDGDGATECGERRRLEAVKVVVVTEDARPVGGLAVGGGAVAGGDAGLEVVFAELGALGGLGEVEEAAFDERVVPFRTVLVVEAEEIAVVAEARGKTRGGEQHEREKGVRARDVAGGVGDEERAEADGFVAELLAEEAFAGGGFVALVEKEVERGEDAVEAIGEIGAFGEFEGDIRFADTVLGARELFFDGGFVSEEGARDFAGAEAAEHLEREDDLGVGGNVGVAADEHEPKRVVADDVIALAVGRRVGDELFEVRDDGRFLVGGHAAVAEGVAGEVDGDARDPGGRIGGEAADGPGAEGAQEGFLRDVLDEREVLRAEEPHQRAVEAAGFVAEEVLDQVGGLRGVGHEVARWKAKGSPTRASGSTEGLGGGGGGAAADAERGAEFGDGADLDDEAEGEARALFCDLGGFLDRGNGEKEITADGFLGFGEGTVDDAFAARGDDAAFGFERMAVLDFAGGGEAVIPGVPAVEELLTLFGREGLVGVGGRFAEDEEVGIGGHGSEVVRGDDG
jgi:hypothetical protein